MKKDTTTGTRRAQGSGAQLVMNGGLGLTEGTRLIDLVKTLANLVPAAMW